MLKGGTTNLNVGNALEEGGGVNNVKTLKFENRWGVHDPFSSCGGAAPVHAYVCVSAGAYIYV